MNLREFHMEVRREGKFCVVHCVELGVTTQGLSFIEAFINMEDAIKVYQQKDEVKNMDKETDRKWEEGKGFGEDGEVYLAPMDMLTGREEDKGKWDVGLWGLEGVTFDNEELAHIYFAQLKLTELIKDKRSVDELGGMDEVMKRLEEQMRLVKEGEFKGIAVFASIETGRRGGVYQAKIDNSVQVINCDEREAFCTLRGISECMDGLSEELVDEVSWQVETKAVAGKVRGMKASLKKGVDNLGELEKQMDLFEEVIHTIRERIRVLKQLEADMEGEAKVKEGGSEGGTHEVVGGKKEDEVGGKEGEVVVKQKK